MATIATAEVRVIADTSRFVPDLRRKLRTAFASLGNQLGDDIVQRIDKRISQRLTTVMNQAARTAGSTFTEQFNRALSQSGLSQSLRDQLGGPVARRGARQAGGQIADAFGDAIEGGNRRISDDMAQALSNQVIFSAAGLAGADTAQAFTDSFRDNLRGDISGRITDAFEDAAGEVRNQIPPLFRGSGERAGTAFNNGLTQELRDINQGILLAFAGSGAVDSSAFFAGQRAGIQYSDGVFESLQDRLARQMREAVEEATETGIPPLFRRMGNASGAAFVEQVEETMGQRLRRLFRQLRDSDADSAGRRFGRAFGAGFANALRALPGVLSRILNTIVVQPLSGLANVFGEMTSEMVSMAGQALAVVALLEALSGLLFALPAAANLAAAGIAAIIVPLLGTKDAFSEAFGEAENFEEALEGLTDPAKSVARELHAIAPALRDLRLPAQAAFFTEIAGAITEVADNLLGPLSDGLETAAGGFGRIVDQIAEFLAQAQTADTLSRVFATLTGIFDALAESTEPFLEGMRILVDEFLPEIEDFEGPLSRIGDEFRDWTESVVKSGAAMEAFERGRDTLDKIFDIAVDISEIFDAMFDAAESVGVDALGAVRDAIAEIREEFESVEGQETLGQVFDALSRITGVVSDVFGAIFDNLAKLAPDIADLFEEIGPPITDLIDGLAEGIQALLDQGGEEFFRDLATELSKIDWAALGAAIGGVLNFLRPLLPFIRFMLNGIIGIFQFVSRIFTGLFAQIDELDANVFQPISEASFDFADWWKELWLEVIPGAIADGVRAVIELAGEVSVFFAVTLPQAIEDGLADALAGLVQWWEDVTQDWKEFWDGLALEATTFFTNLKTDVTTELDGIVQSVETWAANVSAQWTTFWTGLRTIAANQLTSARESVANALATIRTNFSSWKTTVSNTWTTLWNSLPGPVRNAMSAVSSAITNPLGTLRTSFSNFRTSVENTMNALLGTVQRVAQSIGAIVNRVASAVAGAVAAASRLSNLDLNPFANGGIVYGPTPALIGEAGPEVVIPLTRPQRAVDLVQQSGLLSLLAAQGVVPEAKPTSTETGRPIEMHVHTNTADAEQVARRAMRMLERRLSGRGLERTS